MPNAVEQKVIDVICDDLGVQRSNVSEKSRLISDLGLDSVAFAIAIVAIEERFGLYVDESKLRQCDTVADVAALVGPGGQESD